MLRRFFKLAADSFYLFRVDVSEESFSSISLPDGFQLESIDPAIDEWHSQLVQLWIEAYSLGQTAAATKASMKIREYAESGDICVVLLKENRIVGMQWISIGQAISQIEIAKCLHPYDAIGVCHDSYISPIARGQRLQKPMMLFAMQEAYRRGIVQLLTFVGVRNFASIKNIMRFFSNFLIVTHVKIDIPLKSFHFYPGYGSSRWENCS